MSARARVWSGALIAPYAGHDLGRLDSRRSGAATVCSLSPSKQLTAGEGGLIANCHGDLASELRKARNYGKGATYH